MPKLYQCKIKLPPIDLRFLMMPLQFEPAQQLVLDIFVQQLQFSGTSLLKENNTTITQMNITAKIMKRKCNASSFVQ